MERWVPIEECEEYWVSDEGRVRSERYDRLLRISVNQYGLPFVQFRADGRKIVRGLALLVAMSFVPMDVRGQGTRVPIHLDGNKRNCRADNLVWRPRWFAIKHARQFTWDLPDTGPVRNITTGKVYSGVWQVVLEEGCLFNDVCMSIDNKTYVFPSMELYEWAD